MRRWLGTSGQNSPGQGQLAPAAPSAHRGSGRCCRAAILGGRRCFFFFTRRRGTRINPRAYFIGPMNFASQRLPSLLRALARSPRTARAELRPTPQSSFISCQQENKEIINRKLICRGQPWVTRSRGHGCAWPRPGGGQRRGGCRQTSDCPARAGERGAVHAAGLGGSRRPGEGFGGGI